MLQPPLLAQSFLPAHAWDSGSAQPPLPLQEFFPIQQSLSDWCPVVVAGLAPDGAASFSVQALPNRPSAANAANREAPFFIVKLRTFP